jgi:hypothetical protein
MAASLDRRGANEKRLQAQGLVLKETGFRKIGKSNYIGKLRYSMELNPMLHVFAPYKTFSSRNVNAKLKS